MSGAGEGEGFVWPPRPAGVGEPRAGEVPVVEPPTAAPESALESFERAWLGVRGRALARRAALEGWAPDRPEAYCWRCGTTAGPFEVDGQGCAWCRPKRLAWDRFVRVGSYEGILREALLELKLQRWRRTGAEAGAMLGRAIGAELERRGVDRDRCVIVPVPTSWLSRMRRGVDHTLVISRAAGNTCGVRVVRILRRVHGPSQTGASATERAANVRGKIRPRRGVRLTGPGGVGLVIVVDDVRTTGATLREACRAVRGMLPPDEGVGEERVWAAAAGVTPSPTRRAGARAAGPGLA